MKKVILFAAILFAGVSVAKAQTQIEKDNKTVIDHTSVTEGTKSSANTNLTVVLNSIQSISVNTSNVTLEYKTVEDYQKGVSSGLITDHLEINSTGGYSVKVNYSGAQDYGYNGPGLDADEMFQSINVAVAEKKDVNVNDSKLLKESKGAIISSSVGEFGAKFDVDYQGATNYMNSVKKGATRTYIANVFYTIEAL